MNRFDKRKQPIPGNNPRGGTITGRMVMPEPDLSTEPKYGRRECFDFIVIDEVSKIDWNTIRSFVGNTDPSQDRYKQFAAHAFGVHYDMVTDDLREATKRALHLLGYSFDTSADTINLEVRTYTHLMRACYGYLGEDLIKQREDFLRSIPKAPEGKHQHREAFCLMWYRCEETPDVTRERNQVRGKTFGRARKGCGHKERMWNSRDGVTPFGATCPSCGGMMNHVQWELDEYAPEHKPHRGQRIWRDGSFAEWQAVFARLYARPEWSDHFKDKDETYLCGLIQRLAQDAINLKQPYLEVTP